jgi:hypothetical protein
MVSTEHVRSAIDLTRMSLNNRAHPAMHWSLRLVRHIKGAQETGSFSMKRSDLVRFRESFVLFIIQHEICILLSPDRPSQPTLEYMGRLDFEQFTNNLNMDNVRDLSSTLLIHRDGDIQ